MTFVMLNGFLSQAQTPVARETPSGKKVCTLSVAVPRLDVTGKETSICDYFDVVCWEDLCTYVCNNLDRSCPLSIKGRLQNRKVQRKDGSSYWKTEIIAKTIEIKIDGNTVDIYPEEDFPQEESSDEEPSTVTNSALEGSPYASASSYAVLDEE